MNDSPNAGKVAAIATKPIDIVSGKPTEKMFICGAARVITPIRRLTVSIAASAGSAIASAPRNIIPAHERSCQVASAPSEAPMGSVWKLPSASASAAWWPSSARNRRVAKTT